MIHNLPTSPILQPFLGQPMAAAAAAAAEFDYQDGRPVTQVAPVDRM